MKDVKGHGSNPRDADASAMLASGPKSAAAPLHSGTPPRMSSDEFTRIVQESHERSIQADKILSDTLASRNNQTILESGNRRMMISRSLDPKYDLRATDFDEQGPSGHREYKRTELKGLKDEIFQALSGGYKLKGIK